MKYGQIKYTIFINKSCHFLLHFHCTFLIFSSDVSFLFFWNSSLIFNLAALWRKIVYSYRLFCKGWLVNIIHRTYSNRHSSTGNQTKQRHISPFSPMSSSLNTAILVLCNVLNTLRTCIHTDVQLVT